LGYGEWRNFTVVINKAKTACEVSDYAILDHFVDVNKIERRLISEKKKSLKNPDVLGNE